MSIPSIDILEQRRELGYAEGGEKIVEIGRIYGYSKYLGISVLEATLNDETELVFVAVNHSLDTAKQIMNEHEYDELKKAWDIAMTVNLMAGKSRPIC